MLRLCLSGQYKVFSNAIYRGKTKEESTQVDHIIVSRYGIFVLETKCLKGKIITDPEAPEQWLQIVGRRKYRVQNPLMQNYSHVKAVQKVTGVHSQKIHNYAVMAGQARFTYGMPERVYSIWGVIRKIQSYKAPVFTRGHVVSICRSLSERRIKGGYWAARRHVEKLKRRDDAGSTIRHTGTPKRNTYRPADKKSNCDGYDCNAVPKHLFPLCIAGFIIFQLLCPQWSDLAERLIFI